MSPLALNLTKLWLSQAASGSSQSHLSTVGPFPCMVGLMKSGLKIRISPPHTHTHTQEFSITSFCLWAHKDQGQFTNVLIPFSETSFCCIAKLETSQCPQTTIQTSSIMTKICQQKIQRKEDIHFIFPHTYSGFTISTEASSKLLPSPSRQITSGCTFVVTPSSVCQSKN